MGWEDYQDPTNAQFANVPDPTIGPASRDYLMKYIGRQEGLQQPDVDPVDIFGPAIGTRIARTLAYWPQQILRHRTIAQMAPQLGEFMAARGNPISNLAKLFKGGAEDALSSLVPREFAPAAAELGPGQTTLKGTGKVWPMDLGKYGYEIPYVDDVNRYPITLLARNPEAMDLLSSYLDPKGFGGGRAVGLYTQIADPRNKNWLADVVAMEKNAAKMGNTDWHEIVGHMGSKRVQGELSGMKNLPMEDIAKDRQLFNPNLAPEDYKGALGEMFKTAVESSPGESVALLNRGYAPQSLGEEMWARYVSAQPPMLNSSYPAFETSQGEGLLQAGTRHYHPSLFGPPPDVVAPQSIQSLFRGLLTGEYPKGNVEMEKVGTHRGTSAGFDERFAGAEFGKGRTGPAEGWNRVGETETGGVGYRNAATNDLIIVNPETNKVDIHMSDRYYKRWKSLTGED